jgi:phosphoglycolate phosphatase
VTAFTVGFDLDMTLIDSRPGIAATFRELSARTGTFVDADAAVSRLGPPLRAEISRWFPPSEVDAAVDAYRALYPTCAIEPSVALPGVRAALDWVVDRGGRAIVVTSKLGRLAWLHVEHLKLPVDDVFGEVFASGKATALTGAGAALYVGDHEADMVAARTASVPGIGVTTGPCSAAELTGAGAALVLPDLRGFPAAATPLLRLAW